MDYFTGPSVTVQLERTQPNIQPWLLLVCCNRCSAMVPDDREHREQHESFHRGWYERTEVVVDPEVQSQLQRLQEVEGIAYSSPGETADQFFKVMHERIDNLQADSQDITAFVILLQRFGIQYEGRSGSPLDPHEQAPTHVIEIQGGLKWFFSTEDGKYIDWSTD